MNITGIIHSIKGASTLYNSRIDCKRKNPNHQIIILFLDIGNVNAITRNIAEQVRELLDRVVEWMTGRHLVSLARLDIPPRDWERD